MYDKGIIGHVSIDLVVFPNPTEPNGDPLFWAIDLNANMTDYAAAVFFFDILMEGELDKETGDYEISLGGEEEVVKPPPVSNAPKKITSMAEAAK